jgi:hypothetical protein
LGAPDLRVKLKKENVRWKKKGREGGGEREREEREIREREQA